MVNCPTQGSLPGRPPRSAISGRDRGPAAGREAQADRLSLSGGSLGEVVGRGPVFDCLSARGAAAAGPVGARRGCPPSRSPGSREYGPGWATPAWGPSQSTTGAETPSTPGPAAGTARQRPGRPTRSDALRCRLLATATVPDSTGPRRRRPAIVPMVRDPVGRRCPDPPPGHRDTRPGPIDSSIGIMAPAASGSTTGPGRAPAGDGWRSTPGPAWSCRTTPPAPSALRRMCRRALISPMGAGPMQA